MAEVGMYEAKTHLPKLVERVQKGEAVDAVLASRPEPSPVDPRTKREAAEAGTGKKKAKKAEAAAEAPAEA